MKMLLQLIVTIITVIVCSCSSGRSISIRTSDTPPRAIPASQFHTRIDSVLNDSVLSTCFIGVKIVSLDDGKTLYEQNSNKLFHPASNMKLLTTATGLKELGGDFRFVTNLLANARVRNGVLDGDLSVKASGDPLIRTEDLDSLAVAVSNSGITRITGDLIGDVSYFDSVAWGRGWMWDDEPDADEAFISPLTINDNALTILVQPGKAAGEPARVKLNPFTKYLRVINSGITSGDTMIPPLSVTRHQGENTILVRGRIAPHASAQEFMLSVYQPAMYFLTLLKETLIEHGITVEGRTRLDSARGNSTIATLSHSLDSVVFRINKASDNIAAENLLKTIAAEHGGIPGTTHNGLIIMKEYLASLGIDTTAMILEDGSGVSFYNLISPSAIVRLLQNQYADERNYGRFHESLPVAGVDGTLMNRMRGTRAEGNVHAKTGTLTGASGLSGYIRTLDGKRLAFSMLCNHFPSKVKALREAQDRVMEILANTTVTE